MLSRPLNFRSTALLPKINRHAPELFAVVAYSFPDPYLTFGLVSFGFKNSLFKVQTRTGIKRNAEQERSSKK